MINRPHFTYDFFAGAATEVPAAACSAPPTSRPTPTEQPQLSIVERVTIGFFDRISKASERAGADAASGNVRGLAALTADPDAARATAWRPLSAERRWRAR